MPPITDHRSPTTDHRSPISDPMLSEQRARAIAAQFQIGEPISLELFKGRGNINLETYLVTAGVESQSYLLQHLNGQVFPRPDRVMAGMVASIEAQKGALNQGSPHAGRWVAPELVPSKSGMWHVEDGGVWRMLRYIEGIVSYKSLSELPVERREDTAREAGRGLAIYSDLTSSIDPLSVPTALPGYRDTGLYFDLLDAAQEGCRESHRIEHRMPKDSEVREASERHFFCVLDEPERLSRRNDREVQRFLNLALTHRSRAISMQEARIEGTIRTTAIHGDTKIENFLFCAQTGKVVSLVDLDTVMPHSWLSDWGDMVRSLANVAGEKERELSNVQVDAQVYRAAAEGFLETASSPTAQEIRLMPRAVQAIALELGVRFLADYLRGDTYFQIGPGDPADLNKVRALVQLQLFERLLEHETEAAALIGEFSKVGAAKQQYEVHDLQR